MKHIVIESDAQCQRRLPFYLALEEWVALQLPADEYFFTWIVNPTVIVGRNQDLHSEVDLEYCRANGIDVCRRRSGGGCVYADNNNIMISYICPSTDVVSTFGRYVGLVADRLRAIGIEAVPSGRNDIEVDGRKISGNAFYHLPGRSIVHGTMLYDVDTGRMMRAITPSRAKLDSRCVRSVESRVTMARSYRPDLSLDCFRRALVDGLETGRVELSASDIACVEQIESRYYKPGWLLRGSSRLSAPGAGAVRMDGVGELSVVAQTDAADRLTGFDLSGDVFVIGNLSELKDKLLGSEPDAAALALRLADVDVSRYIAGLTTDSFIELLLHNHNH